MIVHQWQKNSGYYNDGQSCISEINKLNNIISGSILTGH